jgi:hypothetical protein
MERLFSCSLLAMLLAGCDSTNTEQLAEPVDNLVGSPSASNANNQVPSSAKPTGEPTVEEETSSSGLTFRELGPPEVVAKLAEQTRLSGFPCQASIGASQIVENGQQLPIFKIDCAEGQSYQLTILNDKPYIKPWTGDILGD